MKKLKNKIFWIIFLIITFFLFNILFIFNYQDYKTEKKSIEKNLMRIQDLRGNRENPFRENLDFEPEKQLEKPQIFMDMIVYTAILDENFNVIEVINHTPDLIDDNTIKNIAENMISKGLRKEKIGNLYFDQYSYSLKNNNILVISDNIFVRERLINKLQNSIMLFILSDILFLYVAVRLTDWAIKPALEALDNQKQFVADASHELKTPIAVIMANSEALENEPNEKKWLNNIKSEAERMNDLISDLLDMAKLENRNHKETYQAENLSKLVEMSILTFESLMYEKKIKLDYWIDENITLNCNGNQIKQLVAILIDNAINHSNLKDGEIAITLKKEKMNIILEVKNKGKEIPKEDREKIFERFYRADEARNRNSNRYGLGLAIAKNIVLNHKGKISVNCLKGYTVFKVVF